MKTGYYPGCSLAGTGKEFDISLRKVFTMLDVEVDEIKEWACCGASSAHAFSHLLAVSLPAHTLALAKEQGYESVLAPCAACYNRLLSSKYKMTKNSKLQTEVENVLEKKLDLNIGIKNIIEYLLEIGEEKIKQSIAFNVKGLNVACYYGCLLVRPDDAIGFDDAENPKTMETICKWIGAKPVDWNFKTECCGAAHSIARTDIVVDLTSKILIDAKKAGADLIVVACPMCHSNLDMRQKAIKNEKLIGEYIPILYLTELLGLAMGIDSNQLGLDLHFVDTNSVTSKITKVEEVAK